MSTPPPQPPDEPTAPQQPWGSGWSGGQSAQPPPSGPGWGQQPGAPQGPYDYGTPPPQKKDRRFGKGCLFGCLGAVLAIVIIVVVLIVVLANSTSKNTDHPAANDVRITSCVVDSTTSLPTAKLEIVNHSSKTSTYIVTVEFDKGGTRVSEGATGSTSVAPNEKVETSAGGPDQLSSAVTCKITNVTRFAG